MGSRGFRRSICRERAVAEVEGRPANGRLARRSAVSTVQERSVSTHALSVRLSNAQLRWLEERGAEQQPTRDAGGMLTLIVERALAADALTAGRRAHQLEVYRASGYPEHHPDYPKLPAGFPNA
jgi:hypothetical protein